MAARQRRGKEREKQQQLSVDAATEKPQKSEDVDDLKKDSTTATATTTTASMPSHFRSQPLWIILAVASGACAAINGVFAKLTTTSLTTTLATRLSQTLGLDPDNNTVNLGLRSSFFGLNLAFNAVMWGLYTAALAKGESTTRVSIVNVSANFFVTAGLGWLVFGERLGGLWWVGAGLLAAGNVVIGMREEEETRGLKGGGAEDVDLIEWEDPVEGEVRRQSDVEERVGKGVSLS